ncbi:MAG: rRNA maturation RNase YbeY [Candidatus Brennerbacteria bacterium]|nr:rRNA maturation RNase YbeY [Candidatus Brennerbacteria bacterium]
MKRVVVRSQYKKYQPFERKVRKAARAALDFLKADGVSAEVHLLSDGEMKRLNRKFRRKNKIANVLAFPEPAYFPYPESRLRSLGEVYLAPDFAARQGENLGWLAVHGVLHLLGFSHSREGDRIRMEKLEQEIFDHGQNRNRFGHRLGADKMRRR